MLRIRSFWVTRIRILYPDRTGSATLSARSSLFTFILVCSIWPWTVLAIIYRRPIILALPVPSRWLVDTSKCGRCVLVAIYAYFRLLFVFWVAYKLKRTTMLIPQYLSYSSLYLHQHRAAGLKHKGITGAESKTTLLRNDVTQYSKMISLNIQWWRHSMFKDDITQYSRMTSLNIQGWRHLIFKDDITQYSRMTSHSIFNDDDTQYSKMTSLNV